MGNSLMDSFFGAGNSTTSPQGGPSWVMSHASDLLGLGSSLAPFPMSLGFDAAQAGMQGSFNPYFGGQQGKIGSGFGSQLGYWSNPFNLAAQFGDMFGGNSNPGGLSADPSGGYGVAPLSSNMSGFNADSFQGHLTGNSLLDGVNFSGMQGPSMDYSYGAQPAGERTFSDPGLMGQNTAGPRNYYGSLQPSSVQQYGDTSGEGAGGSFGGGGVGKLGWSNVTQHSK